MVKFYTWPVRGPLVHGSDITPRCAGCALTVSGWARTAFWLLSAILGICIYA